VLARRALQVQTSRAAGAAAKQPKQPKQPKSPRKRLARGSSVTRRLTSSLPSSLPVPALRGSQIRARGSSLESKSSDTAILEMGRGSQTGLATGGSPSGVAEKRLSAAKQKGRGHSAMAVEIGAASACMAASVSASTEELSQSPVSAEL
jgi:hypothetical protein